VTAAPTFSQIKAQVAGIRQKSPTERVIGIHAQGRWSGSRQQIDGDQLYLIEQCDSPLALRLALREHLPEQAIQVLITPLQEQDLEVDIRLRLAKQRLFVIDQWQIVKSLFRAANIDPRLLKHRWLAAALLDWMPIHRYAPVLGGFLDAEIVWPLILEYGVGLTTDYPDLATLLVWSTGSDAISRYQQTNPEFRAAVSEWLASLAGTTATPILACVNHCSEPDALPLGLAAEVIYHPNAENRLDKAIGKLEERFLAGTSVSVPQMHLWSKAAHQALHRITDPDHKQRLIQRSDQILTDIGAEAYAHLSTISEQGLNQHLAELSRHLQALVKKPTLAALEKVQQSYQRITHHQLLQTPASHHRHERLQMALRLGQWLVEQTITPSPAPKDLATAIDSYLHVGGFLDWARLSLRLAESHRELSIAYAQLFTAVTTAQEDRAHQFANLLQTWTATGSTRASVLPVEQILETVTNTIDDKIPLLILVMDGMSMAVAYELLTDPKNQTWRLLQPAQQSTPLRVGLATLPSITQVSRTSLLCGQLQVGQANQEKQGFAKHPTLLNRCKRGAPPLLFHKAALQSSQTPILAEELHNALTSSKNAVVGVIINAIDDLLSKGEQVNTQWTFDQIKILPLLLQAASQAKRLVILTSDHGHILHTNAKYQSAQGGERWRVAAGEPETKELQLSGERVKQPDATATSTIIAPWTETMRYCNTQKNGYHGGINPQEMIVPIAVLAPSGLDIAGWKETQIQYPAFWELAPISAHQVPAKPFPQKSNDYANYGPLFSFVAQASEE
jgi:hypothetical protein